VLLRFFIHDFRLIEYTCKPNSENPRLHTLAGEIAVKREKKPIITKESIANTDLILYQLSCAFKSGYKWFPTLYCYRSRYQQQPIWVRMQSRRHCEKLFPLFGVSTIEELKKLVARCKDNRDFSYRGSLGSAPNILSSITLEEIATLN